MPNERRKPATPPARPPDERAGTETPNASDPKRVEAPSRRKDPWYKMCFNLGAFLVGCSAGYFFGKAEEKFTAYGENIMVGILKGMRKGRGYGNAPWGDQGEDRFPDRHQRAHHDPDVDPMGDGGGESVSEEDPIDRL